MAADEEVDRETLFWSDTLQEWRPLYDLPNEGFRAEGRDPKAEQIAAGIKIVAYLSTQTESDCPHCRAMEGREFPIAEAPELPLPECTCTPYSGGLWIAKR